jgi:hypothetical protein
MEKSDSSIHRGERKDMFDGGSLVVAKFEKEDALYIHCHGHKLGDVCKIKLTMSEAAGLSRLLQDTVARGGSVVMGLKTTPVSGYTRSLQSI